MHIQQHEGSQLTDERCLSEALIFEPKADYSRFVQWVRRRYSSEMSLLAPGAPNAESIRHVVVALLESGRDLGAALRIARQLVVERLAVLDIEQQAPLSVVTSAMSDLAQAAIVFALEQAQQELDAVYGVPRSADGERCAFWVVGMGKLGGHELNVSSDIDLIYIYEQDGVTSGVDGSHEFTQRSHHEYYSYLAKKLYVLIGKVSEHGFVFRIDLALRPNGESGPLAVSLPMLKTYFQIQGREWERFAWMKGRVIAASGDPLREKETKLRDLVQPFVFRRYLDFNLLESLRQMHQKICQQAIRRAAGHPDWENNVKLSRGGIREIEFIVQLFQVIRGGQYPEIRSRSTLQALERLRNAGLLPEDKARKLQEAYTFLRRVEHRVQYLDDQQTHVLPKSDDDLRWVAASMALPQESCDKVGCCAALFDELGQYRVFVAEEFDSLLKRNVKFDTSICPNGRCQILDSLLGEEKFEQLLPESLREWVHNWANSTRVKDLKTKIKSSLSHLVIRSVQWMNDGLATAVGAQRFFDWLDVILRRENYQAMLLERPLIHQRLLRLMEMSRWALLYLKRYPGVIDELTDIKVYQNRFNADYFEQELQQRRQALIENAEEDEEMLLNLLRRAHHAELFRSLTRDIEGYLTVEQVADDLSLLADRTLKIASEWCWDYLAKKHQETSALAIIAYGKLGGKELGYGSDLDLVFIYDDDHEGASDIYATYVRKLIQWLSAQTDEGALFDIDTALRPNGNSGLLVTSIETFEAYQLGRGSNTAWTWEHQALTRARCAVGSPEVQQRFDKVRHQVLSAKRDRLALRQEILGMRMRLQEAHPVKTEQIDVKHSPGGMLDIEFCVQYLILAYANEYPLLEDDIGNIALLLRAEDQGLLNEPFGKQASDSYRLLRQIQHRARLDGIETFTDEQLRAACEAGKRLWQQIFDH